MRYAEAAAERRREVEDMSKSLSEEAERSEGATKLTEDLQADINNTLYETQRLAEVQAAKKRICDSLKDVKRGVVKAVPATEGMKARKQPRGG
ncbi:unnamed protein product [Sphacelaria rigidula]